MRLFLDASMSPGVASELRARGFDAVDQRDVLKASATDLEVMAEAWRERRIVVARDNSNGLGIVKPLEPGHEAVTFCSQGAIRTRQWMA